ncbi:MAG: 1,6-anhydro-N-acetylmuramyl-L-alanine amidase AmpD [Betaproteobacteria bacterium]|nr:1,6-anhydro-N-acetylmuramyl-L-alanine amidase AmpD [Betaproteobacteria bacterium]
MTWQDGGWLDGVTWLRSPNFGERPSGVEVSLVVIHNISLPPDEFGSNWVEDFFLNRLDPAAHPYFATIAHLQVSAHFYIRRDGQVVQFVGCDLRAWHAGQSRWCKRDNCNDYSIGIELEGSDSQAFTAEQYAALWPLLEALRQRYPIAAMAGHSHVAPGRKTDPGPYFDWAALAAHQADLALPAEVSA